MENRIGSSFWLVCCITLMLIALHYLPPIRLGPLTLRRVNILSELRERPSRQAVETQLPSVPPPPAQKAVARRDTNRILDYGDTTGHGMRPFYDALCRRKDLGRPVRIAFFGDSFIEGDILTGQLRTLLQQRYGGCGVGFVDVGTRNPGFRPTVFQQHEGWTGHVAIDTAGYHSSQAGISMAYYTTDSTAYTELNAAKRHGRTDSSKVSELYFRLWGEAQITATVNGRRQSTFFPYGTGELQHLRMEGNIKRIRWTINQTDSAFFYGTTTEGKEGISLDNFALRGSSGTPLLRLRSSLLTAFGKQRPYDLIILQFGLNVANDQVTDYSYYANQLCRVTEHLKQAFPQAGILIISVGDRENRDEEGELRTLRGIRPLVRYQQQAASQSGVAFWNLFEAMGSEGSMAQMVEANPPEANKDYTHLNFRGGQRLARLLFQALVKGEKEFKSTKR